MEGVDVKVDLGKKVVGGQLSNVVVEVAKASVIANDVDGAGHKSHILNFQLVKFL